MTMRLSCTVTEIRGLKDFGSHDLDLVGSRDVIGHATIGLGMCHFLLVVHWNHAFILHCYGDVKPQTRLAHVIGHKFTTHAPCHVTCE